MGKREMIENLPKKQCFSRDRGALDRKLLLHEDQREVTSTKGEWKKER
jgi:hypothetical protein